MLPDPAAPGILDELRPRPLTLKDWEEEAQAMTAPISVIPTPFPTLNDACRRGGGRQGWRLGWQIVVAGAPGFGKTTIALNCAVHAALCGKRVGIISLEMSRDEIMAIMLSIATHTNEKDLEATPGSLNLTFLQKAALFQSMLDASGGAVYLIDLPRSDLKTVERAAKQMIDDGCQLIVYDYAQRMTVQGKVDDYGRLTDISNTLQGIAKQNKIVSLMLSQFNRGTSGAAYSPKAQGLKGSSAIEDDANMILLIDHSRYLRRLGVDGESPGADIVVSVNKNRHGPLVDLSLFMSYVDLSVRERTI